MLFLWLSLVLIWCITGFCAYGFFCSTTEMILGKEIYKKYYEDHPGLFVLWFSCLVGGFLSFLISIVIFLSHRYYIKKEKMYEHKAY